MIARLPRLRGIEPRRDKDSGGARQQASKLVLQRGLVFWRSGKVGRLGPSHQLLTLISFVDAKTGRAFARFAPNGATEEHLKVLRDFVERSGCPKLVATAEGLGRMSQIPRAFHELGISLTLQDHPEPDGPLMQLFRDVQQRLVPSLHTAGVTNIEAANRYLDQTYLHQWNAGLGDSHFEGKPAPAKEDLDSILSTVTVRVLGKRNELRYKNRTYAVPSGAAPPGKNAPDLRGSPVRIEARFDGSLRFRLAAGSAEIELIEGDGIADDSTVEARKATKQRGIRRHNRTWMKGFLDRPSPLLWKSFRSR